MNIKFSWNTELAESEDEFNEKQASEIIDLAFDEIKSLKEENIYLQARLNMAISTINKLKDKL